MTSLAVVAAFLCCIAVTIGAPATKPSVDNPHWKTNGCAACHDMSSGRPAPIALVDADALCLKCHDGKLAPAEPHPTRRVFKANGEFSRPTGWPLVNEEIRCVTCHDAQFACDLDTHSRAMNRNFLRGPRLASAQAFCLNCHQEPAYKKINPHRAAGHDAATDAHCLVCHTKVPDRATTRPSADPSLKADEISLCRDCHQRHRDPITEAHVGKHLAPNDLAFMFAKDLLGLSSNPSKQLLAAVEKAGARPMLLIQGKGDTMACSTCHNPHRAGVFGEENPMAYGALRFDHQNKLVSPVRGAVWCRHCHAM